MSLALKITECYGRLHHAELAVSALTKPLRNVLSKQCYGDLQLAVIEMAAAVTELKITLGSLRMTGELEQQPPMVRAESLELWRGVDESPETRKRFAHELEMIGDDTLRGDGEGAA